MSHNPVLFVAEEVVRKWIITQYVEVVKLEAVNFLFSYSNKEETFRDILPQILLEEMRSKEHKENTRKT